MKERALRVVMVALVFLLAGSGFLSGVAVASSGAAITLAPNEGAIGNTVRVAGSGFADLSNVMITYAGANVVNASTNSLGKFGAEFKVPSSALGGQTVEATDSSGNSASATFTVVAASITLSPSSGQVGNTVRVIGEGFASFSSVTITFGELPETTATTGSVGRFVAEFQVPSSSGANTVVATDSSGNSANATFTVVSAVITLLPTHGPVGRSVKVSGSGFAGFSEVQITYDSNHVTIAYTNVAGNFFARFTVPTSSGTNTVTATDSRGNSASATFRVTGGDLPGGLSPSVAAVVLHPQSGRVGNAVRVSGSGFGRFLNVTITYGGAIVAYATTGSAGKFVSEFLVPPSSDGGYVVEANDSNGASASATFIVVSPSIALYPSSGQVGNTVRVSGSNFANFSTVSITFNGNAVPGTWRTNAKGRFVAEFQVPLASIGPYAVVATDSSSNTASATFTVVKPAITLDPASGFGGSLVLVRGSGFAQFSAVKLNFNGLEVGSATTGGSGRFVAAFTVPKGLAAGAYNVTATDSASPPHIAFATFEVRVVIVPLTYYLKFSSYPANGGTTNSSGYYAAGANKFVASANTGNMFITWSSSSAKVKLSDALASRVVANVSGSSNLTAYFMPYVNFNSTTLYCSAPGNILVFDETNTGVSVTLACASIGYVTVDSASFAGVPNGATTPSETPLGYYDAQVFGSAVNDDAAAGVCVTNSGVGPNSGVQLWNGSWTALSNPSVTRDQSCGQTSPAQLTGTPLLVTAPSGGAAGPGGAPVSLRTVNISLLPDRGASNLTSANAFQIAYTLVQGLQESATYTGTQVSVEAEVGTALNITGVSTGSTSTEKWVLDSAGSMVSIVIPAAPFNFSDPFQVSSFNITLYYFDLLPQNASMAVVGGGSPTGQIQFTGAPQNATATDSPALLKLDLSTTPATIWQTRGSSGGATGAIPGIQGEQWAPSTKSSWIATAAFVATPVTYFHQFLQSVSYSTSDGSALPSAPVLTFVSETVASSISLTTSPQGVWMDAGTTASAQTTLFTASAGLERWTLSVGVFQVTGPDSVQSLAYLHQLYLTVTGVNIPSQWVDGGQTVTLSTPGVFGRSDGTGSRYASFTLDGGTPTLFTPTTSNVTVQVTMNTPHSVAFNSVTQFELTLASTAQPGLVQVTQPTIPGDSYWYDSGTAISVTFNNVWGATAQSRTNAVSYTVDGAVTSLQRSGSGTFTVSLIASAPHTLAVKFVTQYLLTLSGGSSPSVSSPSPTGDSFYDSGSSVTVTNAYTWSVGARTREMLASYTLDGTTTQVSSGTGSFTTPSITFNGPHSLSFAELAQFLVTFGFTDSSGTQPLTPTSITISLQGGTTESALASGTWLDNQSAFTLSQVVWEGANVAPSTQTLFTVVNPLNATAALRVYNAQIKAIDLFGLPVSGASLSLKLANGTTVSARTGANGIATISLIPIGTFSGTASDLGLSTALAGDASLGAVIQVRLLLDFVTLGLIVGVAAIAIVGVGIVVWQRRQRTASTVWKPTVTVEAVP